MINLKHKKLEVWKLAVKLTAKIYDLTMSFPDHELYGLTSQLRRATVSIPSNIAEGLRANRQKNEAGFMKLHVRLLLRLIPN